MKNERNNVLKSSLKALATLFHFSVLHYPKNTSVQLIFSFKN